MTANRQKVALVTGGAKRIGRAIALALAREGWDVAVHYGQSGNEAAAVANTIESFGQRAVALQCDLADEAAVRELLPRAAATLGPITCVINNASLFDYDDAAGFTYARLDAHMHANLAAPVLLARALYDATPAGAQAVSINLLDQKLYNLNPDFLSYTLSKAGLQAATTVLAQALAPKVRVVGVAPGLTLSSHLQTNEEFKTAHKISPLGESSNLEEITDAVIFVVKNRAITGSTIVVDGGQHLLGLPRDISFMKGS